MTRSDCATSIMNLIRRTDCTLAQATFFLGQGISRIQRQLRVPSMERATVIDVVSPSIQSIPIPNDLLQIIDVFANGKPLEKVAYRQMLQRAFSEGGAGFYRVHQSDSYARLGANINLYPALPMGGQAVMTYYGTFTDLPTGDSSNEATLGFPDLCAYAGASFAGDYFRMDEAETFEGRFQTLLTETQDQATQLDLMGGSEVVQPTHGDY